MIGVGVRVGVRVTEMTGVGPLQSRASAKALFVSLLSAITLVESRLTPMYGVPSNWYTKVISALAPGGSPPATVFAICGVPLK